MQEVIRPQMTVTRAMIEPENLRWYVLCVESGMEETVIHALDLNSYPAAIPTVPRERIRRGKVFRWRTPVAHGYVLLGAPGTARIRWWEIERFSRIYDVLRDENGAPSQVAWECTYLDDGKVKKGGVQTLLADLEAGSGVADDSCDHQYGCGGFGLWERGPGRVSGEWLDGSSSWLHERLSGRQG